MKKQKKSIIIGIVIAVTAVTAAAAGTYGTLSQPQKQQPDVQLTAQRSAAVGELEDPVYTYLGTHYSGEELYQQIDEYASFKIRYQPTGEEIQYMAGLLNESTPIQAIMDAYRFWTTTNGELSLVGQLAAGYQTEFAEIAYWTENVYDEITGNIGLTTEEIKEYLQDSNLTQEDIIVANELSRKNVLSIREILNKRKQGKNWFDITENIYETLQMPLTVPTGKLSIYREIERGQDILRAVFLSKRSDKTLEQWLDYAADGNLREMEADTITPLVADELQRLKAYGLFALTGEEAQMAQAREEYMQQQLAKQGVSVAEVTAFRAQGYDETEILNAAIETQQSGLSLAQELAE